MAYIPRSQVNFKYTNSGFIEKHSGVPYVGDYMATSDGKYYAGHNTLKLGPELIVRQDYLDKETLMQPIQKGEKYFSFVKNVRDFNSRNIPIKNFLKNKFKLPTSKPTPTENDYRNGVFRRYFAKRINNDSYIEIAKSDFDNINEKKGTYDHNLYEIGSIAWYIRGIDVYERNALEIKKAQIKFKNLIYLFPVLNEYKAQDNEIINNLETGGGKLYYEDGTEYVGKYHLHPEKGPMEGAQHSSNPHAKLYYFQSLPVIDGQSYETFLQNYNKITCFKCIQVNKFSDPEVISSKRSSLLGCPANSFLTYEEALDSCPKITNVIDNIDRAPMVENSNNDYSSFATSSASERPQTTVTPQDRPTSGGTSYSTGTSVSTGGGGGTSGGGGGGY
tara:strand:+ start:5050 stop:6216 length:1167 start_codon:yes stop_codon:yes gene_type:complete